jgi:hypothetical protein
VAVPNAITGSLDLSAADLRLESLAKVSPERLIDDLQGRLEAP